MDTWDIVREVTADAEAADRAVVKAVHRAERIEAEGAFPGTIAAAWDEVAELRRAARQAWARADWFHAVAAEGIDLV